MIRINYSTVDTQNKICPVLKSRDTPGVETEGMPNEHRPAGDSPYGQSPIFNIIMDTMICSQTGDFHKCPMRGFTQQLTEIDAENHSETWDGSWRFLMKTWRSIECPEDGRIP